MQTTAQVILIIDGDTPTLELYQRELSRDYQIFTSSDVQQALTLLQTHTISAVVLEPSMPDEQGWSLLAAIKSLPGPAPVPVVLCSTLDERKRGMEMGAVSYLVKPVLPTTLRDTLRQVIRRN
jgi:DNA-binding response OmpR family regulator